MRTLSAQLHAGQINGVHHSVGKLGGNSQVITRLGMALVVCLLATPLAVAAQQVSYKIPLVGALDYSTPDTARLNWWKALRQSLQELGYVEGRSIRFEERWAQGHSERLPGLAAELVRLRVDVLVTGGGESALAAKKATATIPIVMATGADPVRLGLVENRDRIITLAARYRLPVMYGWAS